MKTDICTQAVNNQMIEILNNKEKIILDVNKNEYNIEKGSFILSTTLRKINFSYILFNIIKIIFKMLFSPLFLFYYAFGEYKVFLHPYTYKFDCMIEENKNLMLKINSTIKDNMEIWEISLFCDNTEVKNNIKREYNYSVLTRSLINNIINILSISLPIFVLFLTISILSLAKLSVFIICLVVACLILVSIFFMCNKYYLLFKQINKNLKAEFIE